MPREFGGLSRPVGVLEPARAFFDRVLKFTPGVREVIRYLGDHRADDAFPARKWD
ncbi:hypothetical protein [Nocardia sp. NBC_00403]|uniref:hypothetical protein n=1 Tax=Nocardia sp. NBC_00403 TaxID=2975990 RepID=UPI002E1CE9A6